MTREALPSPTSPLWLLVGLQATVSGASLIVEIVAGRMIAPYVGMSLYSWTAIIAVVLAGFSVGHWWGGRIAVLDTARALRRCAWTLIAAAIFTGAAAALLRVVAGPVLQALVNPLAAITALTGLVFFLPSLFAGVSAPVLAVVAMRGRPEAERALGVMFAAGAIGAIGGTLLAGFVFVAWLGSVATLSAVAGVYALAALVLFALGRPTRTDTRRALAGVGLALVFAISALALPAICDRESQYYCIRTVDLSERESEPVHLMVIDHLAHGISAENAPRVMFTEYTAMLDALTRLRMAEAGRAEFASFHIGGGSYSIPRAWADRGIRGVTVAEIDPAVTAQARADFWFDPQGVTLHHRDARDVLRRGEERYDVIIGDAFTDIAVPAHLITVEFFALLADRLTPGGVFAMNLLDNADRLDALAALLVTLRVVFPSVEVWTEARAPAPGERRVFVLLAGEADTRVSQIEARAPEPTVFAALDDGFLQEIIATRHPVLLTDDYAPIDRLMGLDPITE